MLIFDFDHLLPEAFSKGIFKRFERLSTRASSNNKLSVLTFFLGVFTVDLGEIVLKFNKILSTSKFLERSCLREVFEKFFEKKFLFQIETCVSSFNVLSELRQWKLKKLTLKQNPLRWAGNKPFKRLENLLKRPFWFIIFRLLGERATWRHRSIFVDLKCRKTALSHSLPKRLNRSISAIQILHRPTGFTMCSSDARKMLERCVKHDRLSCI